MIEDPVIETVKKWGWFAVRKSGEVEFLLRGVYLGEIKQEQLNDYLRRSIIYESRLEFSIERVTDAVAETLIAISEVPYINVLEIQEFVEKNYPEEKE